MLQRSAIGKLAITLAVLAVILVAVSAYIISNEASNQLCAGCAGQKPSSSSTETTSIFTSNATSTVGLGLDLMLTLNTTQLVSGHRINATAEVFNELTTVNNVTLASIWPLPALEQPSRSGGCPFYVTVEFFQGHYTRGNLSSSAQSQVNFWTGPPPGCVEYDQSFLPFQPQSDNIQIIGTGSFTIEPISYPVWVSGYYPSTNSNSTTPFPPGVYTVVAGDEWGQVAIQYLTVAPPTTSCPSNTTCASFTYSPTGQVKVDSVQATLQTCQNCGAVNGQSYVYFHIAFENTGSSPIYVFGGFGYCEPISTTVAANSSVLQAVPSERAACAGEIVPIEPGQNYTVDAPYGGDGVEYQLVQAGTVSVVFSFNWTTDPQATTFPNSTTISAQFVFA